MTLPTQDPELKPATPPTTTADAPPEAPPGGEGVGRSESVDIGVSEKPEAIFEQRAPQPEAFLAQRWGIPRTDLAAFRKAHLTADEITTISGAICYPAAAEKKAAAHFGVSEGQDSGPAADRPPAATESASAAYAVARIVRNPKLVLFREKNAAGQLVGPDLRLRVRDNSKFTPGMDLTGRVRLIDGHRDYFDLTCDHPRIRGRWREKNSAA